MEVFIVDSMQDKQEKNSRQKNLPQPKSKFNCVYWSRFDRKWRVKVVHDKKQYDLGGYASEEEAAKVVNWKYIQLGLKVPNKSIGVQPPTQRKFQKKQSKYFSIFCCYFFLFFFQIFNFTPKFYRYKKKTP